MTILAIDTSSEICSTAILKDNKVIDINDLNDGRTHSENLLSLIEEILDRNNVKLNDLDLVACSVGPGSFTGIRIGVSSIKAIAEVLDIPIAGVNSLETLARNVSVEEKATIVSMIDAKNDQIYGGVFDETYNQKDPLCADNIDEFLEKISYIPGKIIFVGNGAVKFKDKILAIHEDAIFEENNMQSAAKVGLMGYKKYQEGTLDTADSIKPLYLRKSQAERMKLEK